MPQHALAPIGAVATDHELSLGKPGGEQLQHLAEQFGTCTMLGIGRRFLAFASLGQPLPVAIEPGQERQAPDLAGCPKSADHQAQHHPVVSPTDQLHGAAGDQGVVVHAGAVNGQAPFAAQGIVAGQFDEPGRREGRQQDAGQHAPEEIEVPAGLAEEAVVATVVTVVSRATGQDQLGNEAAPR